MIQTFPSSASIGNSPRALHSIHKQGINIAIWQRNETIPQVDAIEIMNKKISLKLQGSKVTLIESIIEEIGSLAPDLTKDIIMILSCFEEITATDQFKIFLCTVNTNMCRRFHTDINVIRLLCTYTGPGTLWLANDNINLSALQLGEDNDSIVLDTNRIQQVGTGDIALLKGALYPEEDVTPVVHRSPTIEESGESRLLLRIDTISGFLNY